MQKQTWRADSAPPVDDITNWIRLAENECNGDDRLLTRSLRLEATLEETKTLWYSKVAMSMRLSDTHPEVEKIQIELIRSMPPYQRFQLVTDLIMTGRALSLSGLRERFPTATPGELHRHLATLILGPELATKVYGPEPDPPTLR